MDIYLRGNPTSSLPPAQLLELYSSTLKASCVLDRHAEMPEELEIARSYLRILMACTNSSEVQVIIICSIKGGVREG